MLTIRKIRVASAYPGDAKRAARYLLDPTDSPQAFAHLDRSSLVDRAPLVPTAVWLGAAGVLSRLGVRRSQEVLIEPLVLALQGRSSIGGERVRREGMIQRPLFDRSGRPVRGADGRRVMLSLPGTKSVDLTFSAPKSVSVVWSQAAPGVRRRIELAMLAAAEAMLEDMTQTKPVVSRQRRLEPAAGFAAVASLHVRARTAVAARAPSPQLHVHAVVLGVERSDGAFAAPELSGMFKYGAPLEGGAVGRARLAELLADTGFDIKAEVGPGSRFFEIAGVPEGLIERMSARTRDVQAGIKARERFKGRTLSNGERAVVALETRAAKRATMPPAEIAEIWRAQAESFGFGHVEIDALCGAGSLAQDVGERRAVVRAAAIRRLSRGGSVLLRGEARAIVFESAAGRLRLNEAVELVAQMQASGELPAGPPPQ